jgi:hypothetical protein
VTDIDGDAAAHRQALIDAETLVPRLDEDEDDLLVELGRELLSEGLGFGSEDFDRARRFAAQWLSGQQESLRRQICTTWSAEFADGKLGSRALELATIIDAIDAAYGRPVVNVVAVILLQRGIATFCGTA